MSEFTYACPVCRQHLRCDSDQSGSIMKCPTCFQRIIAPQAPSQGDMKFILMGKQYVEKTANSQPNSRPAEKHAATSLGMIIAIVVVALLLGGGILVYSFSAAKSAVIWQMGYSPETALAHPEFEKFSSDANVAIGESNPGKDWPDAQPGPKDVWAGSRPHTYTVTFKINKLAADGAGKLVIELAKAHEEFPPKLAIEINDYKMECATQAQVASTLNLPFPAKTLHRGINKITITTTSGSWLVYRALKCVAGE